MSKPNIRFRGYTEDWEQRKLGDISESYSGGTPTAGKKEYYDGDIPFIRSGEISGDKTELFITDEGLNNSSAKMVKIGDILYALYGATSGEVSISKLKGAINQAILAIHPHEDYDSQFLMQWLRKSKENIIGTYLQGGQGNLSGNIVKQLLIDVPTYEEQKKIGAYFEYLDNLITLHQRKCEETRKLKKYMLQKMFSQNEKKFPEIRFQGFTEDWEQRKVTELLKNSSSAMKIGPFGSALKKEYFVEEGIKVYAQENAFIGDFSIGDYYITEDKYKELQSCELYPGDLVISMMGTIGACAIFPENAEKGIMNSHLLRLQFDNEVIPKYIMYLLRDSDLIRKQIDRLSVGSIMSGLSSSVVKKLVFPIPTLAEQKRIVEYLDSLNNLITLHQQKYEELQKIKKFMLQNMFV